MDSKSHYQSIFASIYRNIDYYEQMIALSNNIYEKTLYEGFLHNEKMHLDYWWNCYKSYEKGIESNKVKTTQNTQGDITEPRVFTADELSQYDGSNDKPAYVAVNGVVYDVSIEKTWGGGTHFSLYAGKDLTNSFVGCHGGRIEVLKNLPIVGILVE